MKNGAFYLGNMTDADLENLYLSAQTERIRAQITSVSARPG